MPKLSKKFQAILDEINEHREALGYPRFTSWPGTTEALCDLMNLIEDHAPYSSDAFDLNGQGRHTGRDQWKHIPQEAA